MNKRQSVGWKNCNDLKAFIKYSSDMETLMSTIQT